MSDDVEKLIERLRASDWGMGLGMEAATALRSLLAESKRPTYQVSNVEKLIERLEDIADALMSEGGNIMPAKYAAAQVASGADALRSLLARAEKAEAINVAQADRKDAEISRLMERAEKAEAENERLQARVKELAGLFTPDWEAHGTPDEQLANLRARADRAEAELILLRLMALGDPAKQSSDSEPPGISSPSQTNQHNPTGKW